MCDWALHTDEESIHIKLMSVICICKYSLWFIEHSDKYTSHAIRGVQCNVYEYLVFRTHAYITYMISWSATWAVAHITDCRCQVWLVLLPRVKVILTRGRVVANLRIDSRCQPAAPRRTGHHYTLSRPTSRLEPWVLYSCFLLLYASTYVTKSWSDIQSLKGDLS